MRICEGRSLFTINIYQHLRTFENQNGIDKRYTGNDSPIPNSYYIHNAAREDVVKNISIYA